MEFNKLPPPAKYKVMVISGDKITCNVCGHSANIETPNKEKSVNDFIKQHKKCKPNG